MSAPFLERVRRLPTLGLGVSTEYGAGSSAGALDVPRLAAEHPRYARFLEVGVEVVKGLDRHAEQWVAEGRPTTYHFLDVNLDDPDDLDSDWIAGVRALAARLRPAWMCGDAGLWHFGRRDRNHMLLLPPILSEGCADGMADGIRSLREATGYEVLPENPPGTFFVGNLHLLDFYGRVAERADTGLLLDCAHLAIYQRVMGHDPLDGLDGFPAERVVEIHVAGGTPAETDGFAFIDDDHTARVLPDTWAIARALLPRCTNLRAVVFECERNPLADCLPGFYRLDAMLADHPGFA